MNSQAVNCLHKMPIDDNLKRKTEICKNFSIYGVCSYGTRCKFAHGNHELIVKPVVFINRHYKQKPCKQYEEQGLCQFGGRCLFLHNENKEPVELNYQRALNFVEPIRQLEFFSKLSPQKSKFQDKFLNQENNNPVEPKQKKKDLRLS